MAEIEIDRARNRRGMVALAAIDHASRVGGRALEDFSY
jgi:hypothetical protein